MIGATNMTRNLIQLLLLIVQATAFLSPSPKNSKLFGVHVGYRSSYSAIEDTDTETAPIVIDHSLYEPPDVVNRKRPLPIDDPALVEFSTPHLQDASKKEEQIVPPDLFSTHYPFSLMMQGSGPYIAAHAGEIAVFHIPGDLLEKNDQEASHLLEDLALAWLLGMKIVVVVGCRYKQEHCELDCRLSYAHECHNVLKITNSDTLRQIEEEAGYLRTEIERKLNRCLQRNQHAPTPEASAAPEGNVVSGNFYTARLFGVVRDEDFEYTGYTSSVYVENIKRVLDNNDVVLLTTVGLSKLGDLVNVNGYHLAASVAASLDAYKLVYMANEDSVLKMKGEDTSIQELPLSFAQAITDYHQVQVHNTGFATFELARQSLEPQAVELLLHLGWASWALENGVQRAHIVNPGDGALLEELFTSKNGANTCLCHDDEGKVTEDFIAQEDWDDFFKSAAAQGQDVATFS